MPACTYIVKSDIAVYIVKQSKLFANQSIHGKFRSTSTGSNDIIFIICAIYKRL